LGAGGSAPVDWVLLCTKAQHTEAAAPWLKRLCGPLTRVAVLQNGIDHVARVAPLAGGAAVVPVLVYYTGERLAPDRVRLRHGGAHDLLAADDDAGEAFAQLFAGTELRVVLSGDFLTLAWRKLLNVVANPITALTLQRQAVLRRPDVHELCRAILDEAVAVARADGARVADDEAERSLATLAGYSGELGTSMYFDRLAGRTLEVEALTGAVAAAGARHGIDPAQPRAARAPPRHQRHGGGGVGRLFEPGCSPHERAAICGIVPKVEPRMSLRSSGLRLLSDAPRGRACNGEFKTWALALFAQPVGRISKA
jgi:2-dehydropantoate 2-reductase